MTKEKFIDHIHLLHTQLLQVEELLLKAQSEMDSEDVFTKELLRSIESILMKERQEAGVAHPKAEYANQNNARTLLNIAMIFIQHCMQV